MSIVLFDDRCQYKDKNGKKCRKKVKYICHDIVTMCAKFYCPIHAIKYKNEDREWNRIEELIPCR